MHLCCPPAVGGGRDARGGDLTERLYTSGEYLVKNPTWHVEDSAWKANQILAMVERHALRPRTICEVGCGAGEILRQLHDRMDNEPRLVGYDISPQALALAAARASERLEFKLGKLEEDAGRFDLLLVIDVLEHLEDYFSFLRELGPHADHTLLHIPLELSAQTVLLDYPLTFSRETLGHLHFFTRDMALDMLRDLHYDVVDWAYTATSSLLRTGSWKLRALERARRMTFPFAPTAAVRLLGGYSLLVLAR